MVGAMPRHHLVLRHAVQNRVHDWPLNRRLAPAPLGLRGRQADHGSASHVAVQRAALNKHAAPDNFSWLADPLERPAAEREIHRRLALAARSAVAADKMISWRRTRNLQQPHKCVDLVSAAGAFACAAGALSRSVSAFTLVVLTPANVVQRSRWIKPQRLPATVRDQRIHAGALVHLVEVNQWSARIELVVGSFRVNRRTFRVV